MACPDCEIRRKRLRDAIMHGKMADAMDITVEGLRVMIGIDAAADHRRDHRLREKFAGGAKVLASDEAAGDEAPAPDASKPRKPK